MNSHGLQHNFSSNRVLHDIPRKQVRFDTPIKGDDHLVDIQRPQFTEDTFKVFNSFKLEHEAFKQINHPKEHVKPGGSIFNDQNYLPPTIFRHGSNFLTTFKDNKVPAPCRDLELSILEPPSKEIDISKGNKYNEPSTSQAGSNQKSAFFTTAGAFETSSIGQHAFPIISPDIATAAANSNKQFYDEKIKDSFGFFTVPNLKFPSPKTKASPINSVADNENDLSFKQCGGNSYFNAFSNEKSALQTCRFSNNLNKKLDRDSHQLHSPIQNDVICNNNKVCCTQRMECCNSFENSTNHCHNSHNCCNNGCKCCRKCPCNHLMAHSSHVDDFKDSVPAVDNGIEGKRKSIELKLLYSNGNVPDENLPIKHDEESKETIENKPSVSDLYEIIKMQNEQLKMLQQRVDDLLTAKNSENQPPSESSKTIESQGLNLNCVEQSMHKISIGVMTSFEVVMSSNVVRSKNDTCIQNPVNLNKSSEKTTQNALDLIESKNDNQNGCNFLDGIEHCNKNTKTYSENGNIINGNDSNPQQDDELVLIDNGVQMNNNLNLNGQNDRKDPLDLSAVNFDNNPDLQPNLGWTFYNNVMNRVNHKLQSPPEKRDTEKCSPLARNLQMQQLSKAKRVTLDTLPEIQPQFQGTYPYYCAKPMSETSLHMKQLAAKYLGNGGNIQMSPQPSPMLPHQNNVYPVDQRNEMSFATLQYMERYQLLSVGNQTYQPVVAPRTPINMPQRSPQYLNPIYKNPSRILDITVLKQQPKLM